MTNGHSYFRRNKHSAFLIRCVFFSEPKTEEFVARGKVANALGDVDHFAEQTKQNYWEF